MNGLLNFAALSALSGLSLAAASDTATVSNMLNANISALGVVSVPGSATLTTIAGLYQGYQATVTVQYRARTTTSGGGNVTLLVTSDFQAGGPLVSGGNLTYTCGAASLGSACGATTASTSTATGVVTLPSSACTGGAGSCSAADPNSVVLTFVLADPASAQTGSYTATILFTISAT